jgi:hypothetical protein
MKPTVLYHGSQNKLIGDELIPRQARGLKEEDKLEGVYATRIKEFAIIKAILSSSGVNSKSSIDIIENNIHGLIHNGWPEAKEVYVYHLNPDNFENIPRNSHQYVSFKRIKPLEIEVIKTEDYIYLIKQVL